MTKFKEILSNIHSKHVYIQTHNFPDPDAIASGFGLSVLLKKYDIDSSICYKGQIEKTSTNDLVNKLGIELYNLDEIQNMNEDDEIILVDSQKGNSNIFDAPGDEIICIDHHPCFDDNQLEKYRYYDIRPEIGACTTIIANYYIEENIPIDKKVATALLFGLKMDTMNLSRNVSKLDLEVFYKLFLLCDKDLIESLQHCSLKLRDLKAYATAINSIKVYGNISFANTGYDCPEALIASISDFMLDIVEVDFSVVYSIKPDGIKLSIRSFGSMDAGIITNRALYKVGSGGGHASMAGGFVPFKDNIVDTDVLIEVIENRFMEVIETYQN